MTLPGKACLAALVIFVTCKSTSARGFGEWSNFTECSRTCGDGFQLRERSCPQHPIGRRCGLEDILDTKLCFLRHCPIDGGWTSWSRWSTCSKSCGNDAIRARSRFCFNPPPRYGGQNCQGPRRETGPCPNRRACPARAEWSTWTEWGECRAKACRLQAYRYRRRTCVFPTAAPNALPCSGSNLESETCRMERCGERTPKPDAVSSYSSLGNDTSESASESSFAWSSGTTEAQFTTESDSFSWDSGITPSGEDAVPMSPKPDLRGTTQAHLEATGSEIPSVSDGSWSEATTESVGGGAQEATSSFSWSDD
ncbi:thrombospondin-2-like [Diadema setosum]|uniref:thrombospondin-2-like n=1 Tax=Diadema setosum TaxID=31175 RepID=UPI003B3B9689